MIFDLVKDFAAVLDAMPKEHPRRRILKLLDEAIRRDVHFIDRHPTTLFQCLWNSCWWYDCPQAANHYILTTTPDSKSEFPWFHPGLKLFDVLEVWRREKEQQFPGFVWIRSLRPPEIGLGTGQVICFPTFIVAKCYLSFSPDNSRLAIAGESFDKRADRMCAYIHNSTDGREHTILVNTQSVAAIQFVDEGRYLVTATHDGLWQVWDIASGAIINSGVTTVSTNLRESAYRDVRRDWHRPEVIIACHHDMFAVGGEFLTTVHCDIRKGVRQSLGSQSVVALAYSHDGRRLAIGSASGNITIWNLDISSPGISWSLDDVDICGLRFTHDDRVLVVLGRDHRVLRFESQSGLLLQTVNLCDPLAELGRNDTFSIRAHGAIVHCISDDGRFVASAGSGKVVRVWDCQTGRLLHRFRGNQDQVADLAFSRDATLIASESLGQLRVNDLSATSATSVLRGHSDTMGSFAISDDGTVAVTAGVDNAMIHWDVDTGLPLEEQVFDSGIVVGSQVDGHFVMVGDSKKVSLWDLHLRKAIEVFDGDIERWIISDEGNPRPLKGGLQIVPHFFDGAVVRLARSEVEVAFFPERYRDLMVAKDKRVWIGKGPFTTYVHLHCLEGDVLNEVDEGRQTTCLPSTNAY